MYISVPILLKYIQLLILVVWTILSLSFSTLYIFSYKQVSLKNTNEGEWRNRGIRPGTRYPHVTWAHVMLLVHLGYFNIQFWRTLTLLSLCLRHVIWRGTQVGSRASMPLKFLLSHTFRETWRTCPVLFIVTSCFQKWRKCLLKIAPTDLFIWHQVTRL
jgi:hypothetical protein